MIIALPLQPLYHHCPPLSNTDQVTRPPQLSETHPSIEIISKFMVYVSL